MVIIKANKFEFDKVENILKAQGNVQIEDEINNYNFSAKNIIWQK